MLTGPTLCAWRDPPYKSLREKTSLPDTPHDSKQRSVRAIDLLQNCVYKLSERTFTTIPLQRRSPGDVNG